MELALPELQKAVELAPANPGFNQMLAGVMSTLGDHGVGSSESSDRAAIKSFRAGLKLLPNDPNTYVCTCAHMHKPQTAA